MEGDNTKSHTNQYYEIAPYTEFFSWGSDAYGQLALANSDDDRHQAYAPQAFYFDAKSLSFDIIIRQISCGDFHSSFISGDGFLFSVGRNTEGQLGVNDPQLQRSSAPLLVETLPLNQALELVKVSCGGNHTAVLLSNGDIYTWGEGKNGALGQNTTANQFTPAKIKSLDYIQPVFANVECGKKHTMCIDNFGHLYGCGENTMGQLGVAIQDKIVVMQKNNEFKAKASKVACGKEHTLVLTEEGTVYATGNNLQGNLGMDHNYSSDILQPIHGTDKLTFVNISAGRHSAAITVDMKLYVWGPVFVNESPLLLPQELRSNKLIKAVQIGEKTSVILDEDYHVYTWGLDNSTGQLGRRDPNRYANNELQLPQLVESLEAKKVTQIAVGLDYCLALGQDFDQNGLTMQYNSNHNDLMSTSAISQSNFQTNSVQPTKPKEYEQYKPEPKAYHEKDPLPQTYDMYKPESRPYEREQLVSSYQHKPPIVAKDNSPKSYKGSAKEFDRRDRFQSDQFNDSRVSYVSKHSNPETATGKNADLYKQIDTLREENFQLKQKQRTQQQSINELKVQNEMLIENSEQEILKLNEYIDKFVGDVEIARKQQEKDWENRVRQESDKAEEIKRRFQSQQNEIESKLDKVQQEIVQLRQENLQLNQSKQSQENKISDLNKENDVLKQQIKQLQTQQKQQSQYQSPIGQRTPILNSSKMEQDNYLDRTPKGTPSQPMNFASNHKYDTRQNGPTQEFGRSSFSHSSQDRRDSYQMEDRIRPVMIKDQRIPTSDSKQSFDRKSSYVGDGRTHDYPLQRPSVISNFTPYINKGTVEQQPVNGYKQREEPNLEQYRQQYGQQKKYQNEITSPTNGLNNSRQNDSSNQRHPITHYENTNHRFNPSDRHSRHDSLAGAGTTTSTISPSQPEDTDKVTINDVKTRLMNMQKNKEELEQKLKNYEAKLKQHYKLDK